MTRERDLQTTYGTARRADTFYDRQMLDHLNDRMREFIGRQEMVFIATADAEGDCDASFRAGPPGFVHVVDARTLAYPEYRGNGVMASLGNIAENARVGLLFIDFYRDVIGLHVNGRARVIETSDVLAGPSTPPAIRDACTVSGGRRPERWVRVTVEEAYVHCSKHIPWLAKRDKEIYWGTDDARAKGGDYFGVARDRTAGGSCD